MESKKQRIKRSLAQTGGWFFWFVAIYIVILLPLTQFNISLVFLLLFSPFSTSLMALMFFSSVIIGYIIKLD